MHRRGFTTPATSTPPRIINLMGYKHNTGQCTCAPPFILWTFPTEMKDADGRKQWIKLVNRKDWKPKSRSRICSIHFCDGKPTLTNPYPTEHLGYDAKPPSARKPPAVRKPLQPSSSSKQTTSSKVVSEPKTHLHQHSELSKNSTNLAPVYHTVSTGHVLTEDHEHSYCAKPQDIACQNCIKLQQENERLKRELELLRGGNANKNLDETNKENKPTTTLTGKIINRFTSTDKKVCRNTGLQSKAALDGLHKSVEQKATQLCYWRGTKAVHMKKGVRNFTKSPKKFGPARKLGSRDELILVLMKIRLGVTNTLLCDIFGISEGLCSNIINTWIPMLASHLKSLIFWPAKEAILQHMPPALGKKYPQLRCTIDCTEIFIQRPRRLELQQLTWSDYKKHNTIKYLVGIAPNGTITFLSDGYGGRSSDKSITLDSGFLNKVDPGDVILADRGFTIAGDLLQKQARLEIPPPSSGWTQQTASAVGKTKKVANARIHVERAIGRIKWFAILQNTLPVNMVPIIDDIVVVCAALSNLRPPLVGT
ncbi:uncharacterized protein LOC144870920 [Branchiostoma floridae x Branchiostoma japonicum]